MENGSEHRGHVSVLTSSFLSPCAIEIRAHNGKMGSETVNVGDLLLVSTGDGNGQPASGLVVSEEMKKASSQNRHGHACAAKIWIDGLALFREAGCHRYNKNPSCNFVDHLFSGSSFTERVIMLTFDVIGCEILLLDPLDERTRLCCVEARLAADTGKRFCIILLLHRKS